MELTITPTHKAITLDRKNLIQSLTVPSTKEEILSFLEIPSFLQSTSFYPLGSVCSENDD